MLVRRSFLGLSVFLLGACNQIQKISDAVVKPAPREIYARSFSPDNGDYALWKNAFQLGLKDSLTIDLPYKEVGSFASKDFPVYTYETMLQNGYKLVVAIGSASDSLPVFIDVFKVKTNDRIEKKALLNEKSFGKQAVEFPVQETGLYKISIQPGLYAASDFQIEIYTKPTLGFPVVNVSDKAIQSFWGASRSAGKRIHEGVDIFAPRLTPVLAVTDGRIGYTGEKGLGGKQVWLREGIFKKTFYYAHLDSIKVNTAEKVALGDTLGFVGNTGNASTTAPHLHFGIYTTSGPIDPLPFIRSSTRLEMDIQLPSYRAIVKGKSANLRISPKIKSEIVTTLERNDTLTILGRSVDWYRIQTKTEVRGFVYKSLLKELDTDEKITN